MQFKDVIGQSAVKQRLIEAVRVGRVPHAQLFVGPSDSGKLPLALAYAQYLACKNRTDTDSCGTCPSCLQYAKLQHPDLHFAFPIVKSDSVVVCDDVVRDFRDAVIANPYLTEQQWYEALGADRKQGLIYERESGEILRKLSLKAYGDGYKVMIIWQAERMNRECANKLLKLIEEPAPGTLLLLITDAPDQILETIRSRTQPVELQADSEQGALSQQRMEEDCALYYDDFIAIMRNAWAIGQAKNREQKFTALKAVRDWSVKMASADMGRERQKAFLRYAQRQIRENFIRNYNLPELNIQTDQEAQFSTRFAPFIHQGNVEKIMLELDRAEQQIAQNGSAKIIFFDMCLQLIVLIKK